MTSAGRSVNVAVRSDVSASLVSFLGKQERPVAISAPLDTGRGASDKVITARISILALRTQHRETRIPWKG